MENNKKTAPEIRFPGYTDPWEQRKLGDMATFSKGKGYSKSDLCDDGDPIILYGRLYTKYETVISEVDTFAEAKDGSVYSVGGEVIVPASGETAEEISIASVVANSGVLLGGDLNVISPSDSLDPAFLAISITFGNPHNEMAKLAQGKTVVHLHNDDLKKIDLLFPTLEEQRRIRDVFYDIDNIITLHQRKCDELKNYKKGLLQQMFPQPGESFPRVRFPGFTDPWEQRKLGVFLVEKTSKTSDFDSYPLYSLTIEDGITPKTERYERNFLVRKTEDLFKIVEPGDFVTNPMNLRFGALGYNQNDCNISVSGYYDVFSIDNNRCNSFWYSYFKTPSTIKYFDDSATGSLIEKRRVKYSTLKNLLFYVPATIEERIVIGRFFSSIENLITLHQRNNSQ